MGYGVCRSCGRELRRNSEKAVDFPGTVPARVRDLCQRCFVSEDRRVLRKASRDLSVPEQTVLYALLRNLRGVELDRLSSMLGLSDDSRSQSMYGASQALSSIQPMGAHL